MANSTDSSEESDVFFFFFNITLSISERDEVQSEEDGQPSINGRAQVLDAALYTVCLSSKQS